MDSSVQDVCVVKGIDGSDTKCARKALESIMRIEMRLGVVNERE